MSQPKNQPIVSLWWLISLAGIGALLVFVPPLLVSQYERAKALGETAGTVYLIAMGIGLVLLHVVAIIVMWRIWRNTRQQRLQQSRAAKNPSQMSSAEKQREVDENLASVRDLREDDSIDDDVRDELDPLLEKVTAKTENQALEIVAFGTISSGKSSLLNALAGRDVFSTDPKGGTTTQRNEIPWPGDNHVRLVDTPGLGEVEGLDRHAKAAAAAQNADLVLLVVDGPLRQSEFALLEQLAQMEKRVLICLNKEDWYGEAERTKLLGQIAEQTAGIVPREDILTVRSRATTRTRMRVAAGGESVEEEIDVPADIEPLAKRMMTIVRKDGRGLLLANLLLQSRGLVEEAKRRVEAGLDKRAWQIVDRYTWSAGGAAAAPARHSAGVSGSRRHSDSVGERRQRFGGLPQCHREEPQRGTALHGQ